MLITLITEPPLPSAWLLGLGSKLFANNIQRMLNKDLTRFMQIESFSSSPKKWLYWLGAFLPEIRPPSQLGPHWAERVVMLLWCTLSFVLGYRVQESGKVTFETLKVCNNFWLRINIIANCFELNNRSQRFFVFLFSFLGSWNHGRPSNILERSVMWFSFQHNKLSRRHPVVKTMWKGRFLAYHGFAVLFQIVPLIT